MDIQYCLSELFFSSQICIFFLFLSVSEKNNAKDAEGIWSIRFNIKIIIPEEKPAGSIRII